MENSLAPRDMSQAYERSHQRKAMFVTANLSSSGMTGNVRVRNISDSGALIEADTLPPVGERVKLRKGELSATGTIIRREGKQAGIRFERLVNAIDWLPNKAHSQLMVDIAFETIKPRFEGGPPTANAAANARAEAIALPSSPATRDELEGIADMLDALADRMSEDPVILASYLDKLQVLDIASQKLRKVGRNLPDL